MCWSGEASAVLATMGFGTTFWAAYKKEPTALWVALGYFSLMELLQAFTYSVIDQCELPSNQIATLFGYLHITFQPFFINAVGLYFIPAAIRKRIAVPVYTLCFIGSIFTLIQLYPFSWAGHCDPARTMCADKLCSVHGNWHIAWDVPINGIGNMFANYPGGGYFGYMIPAFLIPLLYGSWRAVVYHLALGPFLAGLLTSNNNEWPAVWCLLSIGILMIVVKTPIRRWLHVRRWILWPKSWLNDQHPEHKATLVQNSMSLEGSACAITSGSETI